MKKGYIRLLIFSLFLIIILIINSFFYNFLSNYNMIIFLIILLIFFNKYLVIEKERNYYLKDILKEIFFFFIIYFLIYYLLGLIVGLYKTSNYLTFNGIKDIILPIILYIILREILRYNMLLKVSDNILGIIMIIILFILFDITNNYYYTHFNSQYDVLKFLSLIFLPIISHNISYTFISQKVGYKVVIIFDLIINLYSYMFFVLPNLSEYITSIISIITPIFFFILINKFYIKKEDELISSDYQKKKFKGILLPVILILIMIYLYSGYFKYYAIAIASGSMEESISKGDVVIINQDDDRNLVIGDIIAFQYNNFIIVHRIIKKVNINDSNIYYTKGDANTKIDDFFINDDMILGKVVLKIPYIGLPTIWFNEK